MRRDYNRFQILYSSYYKHYNMNFEYLASIQRSLHSRTKIPTNKIDITDLTFTVCATTRACFILVPFITTHNVIVFQLFDLRRNYNRRLSLKYVKKFIVIVFI
jgi:hypothetical protein